MTKPTSPNESLVGKPGSRNGLTTPALVLDLDALENNIIAMSNWAATVGIKLRPHAKTHKSVEIARRQIEYGAIGVCCATLGEAQVMADAGVTGLLLTSTVSCAAKAEWAAQLAMHCRLAVAVDNTTALDWLAKAAADANTSLGVLIDLDLGSDRSGTKHPNTAVKLARQVESCDSLEFEGIQAYDAHSQHVTDYEQRNATARKCADQLKELLAAFRHAGLAPNIVTGSGTGCFAIDAQLGLYTELQVGSYVFMDTEYRAVQSSIDPTTSGHPRFASALFVATCVASHRETAVIVDAGQKAIFRGGPTPRIASSGLENAVYQFAGDEHGRLELYGDTPPSIGETIELEAPHCDPTVSLHNWYHAVRGDELVAIWPVDARGV